jgi:shikimate kinase
MPKTNIVLYGFMCTGKSTVGKALADHHGMEFIDTDDIIVDLEGVPIDEVFQARGEMAFRARERDIVREVAAKNNTVIATGGGVPLDPNNVELLSENGVGILLMVPAATVLERLKTPPVRPLLKDKMELGKIQSLMSERRHAYGKIPHRLDTTRMPVHEVARQVWELFEKNRGDGGKKIVKI